MRTLKLSIAAIAAAAAMALSLGGCDQDVLDYLLEYDDTSQISTENRDGPYEVVKVVDGDTIKLMIDGEKKNVRLIGIDTPESVHPDKEKNVPEGKLASDHTKELVGDNQLYIEYGTEPEDRYGRPLCYVYLPDGTMLNEQILRDGYARVMIVGKNNEYKDIFTEIESEARSEGRGLWSTGVFDSELYTGDVENEKDYGRTYRRSCGIHGSSALRLRK